MGLGYEIKGRRVGTSGLTTVLVGGGNTTSKSVFGLLPSTTYEWLIRTWCDVNGVKRSDFTAFTPFTTLSGARLNDGSVGDFGDVLVGSLEIYPNPFDTYTILDFPNDENEEMELRVINLQGKLVHIESGITGTQHQLSAGDYAAGLYYVEIQGSKTYRGKLVIE